MPALQVCGSQINKSMSGMFYAIETLEIELSRLKEVGRKLEAVDKTDVVDKNTERLHEITKAINILKGRRVKLQTISQIAEVVTEHFDVSIEELLSKSRRSDIVKARHFVMYLANRNYHQSLVAIAKYLNIDHTTVIHGLRALENSMNIDSATKKWKIFFEQQLNLLFEPVEQN